MRSIAWTELLSLFSTTDYQVSTCIRVQCESIRNTIVCEFVQMVYNIYESVFSVLPLYNVYRQTFSAVSRQIYLDSETMLFIAIYVQNSFWCWVISSLKYHNFTLKSQICLDISRSVRSHLLLSIDYTADMRKSRHDVIVFWQESKLFVSW